MFNKKSVSMPARIVLLASALWFIHAPAAQAGGVYKSTNGGGLWSAANRGLTIQRVLSFAIDSTQCADLPQSRIVYVGTQGAIYKSTDSGANWLVKGLAGKSVLSLAVNPADPNIVYAGTSPGGVYRSTDGGDSWSALNDGLPPPPQYIQSLAIHPANPYTIYAGTRAGVFRYGMRGTSGGNTWRSTSGGGTWMPVNNGILPPYRNITSLVFNLFDPGAMYASYAPYPPYNQSGVLKSTDGGESWAPVNMGLPSLVVESLVVDLVDPDTVYAGTVTDGVFRYDSATGVWMRINVGLGGSDVRSLAVDTSAPGTVYAGTFDRGIFKSTNRGTVWSEVNLGLDTRAVQVLAVDPFIPDTLYAGTWGDQLRHFTVGANPRAVASGDFDGDSNSDLAVVNYGSNNVSILLWEEKIFKAATHVATATGPQSVASGDFNGDGIPDLAVVNQGAAPLYQGTVSILLGNRDGTFSAARNYTVGTNPGSIVVKDLDGDGQLDLAVANRGSSDVSVLIGIGDGTFRPAPAQPYAVGTNPGSIVVGDFDGDNRLDLAVANAGSGTVSVLLQAVDGSFSAISYTTGMSPGFIAVADFNGDNRLDLAVANAGSGNVSILLQASDGTFAPAQSFTVGVNPGFIAVAKFRSDARLDLAVANAGSSNVSVLLGNGDGTFGSAQNFAVGTTPSSLAVTDFNGDAKLDLAVVNAGSSTVSVLLGNGDGTFGAARNLTVGSNPSAMIVEDINGDNTQDLAVASAGANKVSLWLGKGDGTFRPQVKDFSVGSGPRALVLGDFNGDGRPDLAVANQDSGNVSILLGVRSNFKDPQNVSVGDHPTAVAVGDFNGDDNLDLAVTSERDGRVYVLLGNGTGTFQAPRPFAVGTNPSSITVGVFRPGPSAFKDLAVANAGSGNVSVLLGNGDGTFRTAVNFPVGLNPSSIATADFNGDGFPDLAVTGESAMGAGYVYVLLRHPRYPAQPLFQAAQSYPVGDNPSSVAVGVFRPGGLKDLAVANTGSNNVSILRGNGDGTFQSAQDYGVGEQPSSVTVMDFYATTQQYLAVANGGATSLSILKGNGASALTFQLTETIAEFCQPTYVTAARVNTSGSFVAITGQAPDGQACMADANADLSNQDSPNGVVSTFARCTPECQTSNWGS